jgi:hypothetical protein
MNVLGVNETWTRPLDNGFHRRGLCAVNIGQLHSTCLMTLQMVNQWLQ